MITDRSDIQNTKLDRGRDMTNHQPPVVAQTGPGPGVGGAPLRGVDAVLVLHPHRNYPVLQLGSLCILIFYQSTVRLAGEKK